MPLDITDDFDHLWTLTAGCTVEYFDYDYGKCATAFLDKYDNFQSLLVITLNSNCR